MIPLAIISIATIAIVNHDYQPYMSDNMWQPYLKFIGWKPTSHQGTEGIQATYDAFLQHIQLNTFDGKVRYEASIVNMSLSLGRFQWLRSYFFVVLELLHLLFFESEDVFLCAYDFWSPSLWRKQVHHHKATTSTLQPSIGHSSEGPQSPFSPCSRFIAQQISCQCLLAQQQLQQHELHRHNQRQHHQEKQPVATPPVATTPYHKPQPWGQKQKQQRHNYNDNGRNDNNKTGTKSTICLPTAITPTTMTTATT